MMSNLTINTFVATSPQQQLQQLLEQQAAVREEQAAMQEREAAIQAQIESISAGPHHHHRSPIHKQHHRRREIPRSMSTSGAPSMSRHLSSDRAEAAAISRSLSQRSAPSMARTNSRGSTSQRSGGNIPFASNSNGTVRPLTLPTNTRQDNVVMEDWTAREQPFSPYAPSHQSQPLSRSISQRKPELQRVPEHSRFLEDLTDPSEYLKTLPYGGHIVPGLSLSPPISMSDSNMINGHRSSTGSFDYPTPSTPSTTQLTHATTFDNTMSRTSSHFNDNFDLNMMRISSSTSYSGLSPVDHVYDQYTTPTSSPCHIRRSSSEEQKQLLAGTGGASHDSQFSHSLPPFQDSGSFGTKMEKSDSSESNSSSSSRSKMRLKAQNENALSRPLAPRGGDENAMSRSNSSQSMLRSGSKDGQDKVAISKPTYQRPKHDRVYCKQCENHPEGFRGEHELRRHQDREHKKLVKKFICVEPTGEGRLKPILPLSKCKACGQLKREYGAYYNAAAHLRRAHFKPKVPKGRGKGLKEVEEKRGGKGGGDWPPMTELKHWMKEVEVEAVVTVRNDPSQQDQEQDEADLSEDEVDAVPEQIFNNKVNNVNTTNNTNNNNDYQNAYYADATPYYQQTDMSFDMSISLDLQAQYTDSSMYYGSSQENSAFFSSQVLQNDPLAFVPQQFADPGSLTGLGFQNFSY